MNTIYEATTQRDVFTGNRKQCWRWLMKQSSATCRADRISHMWKEDNRIYIDVGHVFFYYE